MKSQRRRRRCRGGDSLRSYSSSGSEASRLGKAKPRVSRRGNCWDWHGDTSLRNLLSTGQYRTRVGRRRGEKLCDFKIIIKFIIIIVWLMRRWFYIWKIPWALLQQHWGFKRYKCRGFFIQIRVLDKSLSKPIHYYSNISLYYLILPMAMEAYKIVLY